MTDVLLNFPEQTTQSNPPITSIKVLSTGHAEQHKEHRYGTRLPQFWWILFSQNWVPLPLQFFVIEHRDGLILFDTGIDPAFVTEKDYIDQAIGRFLVRKLFRFHVTEQDRLDHVLKDAGLAASDIRLAVISHLHFDHVGGIAQIPQADLLVSDREWAILSDPHPEYEWILRKHFELPTAKWRQISFEPTDDPLFEGFDGIHDVTGDGSLILLPTPGHTRGSMSMLIRRTGWAPILLVGDLTYETALLEQDRVPATGDADTLRASFAKVRRLKDRLPDLVIIASHDGAAGELLSRATGAANTAG